MRICSLLPSSTEIVFALGLGDSLVGVTHECDFPLGDCLHSFRDLQRGQRRVDDRQADP